MFVSCGGVGQAGVAAVRRTLQLYKSLMRPASLKNALIEQHKFLPSPCVFHPLLGAARTLPLLTHDGQVRNEFNRAADSRRGNAAADDDVDHAKGFKPVKVFKTVK